MHVCACVCVRVCAKTGCPCPISLILKSLELIKLSFSALKDRTNNLFKQVYEQKSLKGRANDAIASACLYIACRQEGVPRTFKGKQLVARIKRVIYVILK